MSKLLHCAILVTVAALLACSNSAPTPVRTNTSAPAATPVPSPTSEPTAMTMSTPTPETMATPDPAPTTAPTANPGPAPTSEPEVMPEPAEATGAIAPLRMDDPEAFLAGLSDTERSCVPENSDPRALMALLGAPELASPDEAEQLIQCLEDETLMRLFLTGLIGQAGMLSEGTSECIRGGFSGFDLRSMMLTSATGGDEGAGMAGGMAAFFLTLSCLDEDEWAAADPALGVAPGDRETLQCVMEALGGPEGVAAALQPAGGGPPAAFFEAAMGCGMPNAGGEPTAAPMPTPSQETSKATPLPAPGSQTGAAPEIRPAGDPNSPFVQVSVGLFHSCGLRADGSIVCWGVSGEDERRVEATGLIDSPPGTFSQISAGDLHSCALRRDGTVECWGGMPVEDDMPPEAKAMMEAMLAPPEGRFISVSAGFQFSCGVRTDNTAECWGLAVVAGAPTPPDGEYTSVSAGGFHACGIRIDQTVVCWGSNSGFDGDFLGQATPPDGPFEVISAGGYHTCGFRPDGEIRCWGGIVGGPRGEFGLFCQLKPDGTELCETREMNTIEVCELQPDGASRCRTDERATEAYVAWGGGPDSVPDGNRKAIDSGQRFSCALFDGGHIGCWGSGGINDPPPTGIFTAVTVGDDHGCGLRADGSIECWGDDTFGRASPP